MNRRNFLQNVGSTVLLSSFLPENIFAGKENLKWISFKDRVPEINKNILYLTVMDKDLFKINNCNRVLLDEEDNFFHRNHNFKFNVFFSLYFFNGNCRFVLGKYTYPREDSPKFKWIKLRGIGDVMECTWVGPIRIKSFTGNDYWIPVNDESYNTLPEIPKYI